MALFEPVFAALNAAGVRYVVVGGVAVVLHGYARLTGDVDLCIDLSPAASRAAISALMGLGMQPRLPVDALQFADPTTRAAWIHERSLRVFTMVDPTDPLRAVDLFATNPIPFERLFAESALIDLGALAVRVASIPHLIQLKRLANRPRDMDDIEKLLAIQRKGRSNG